MKGIYRESLNNKIIAVRNVSAVITEIGACLCFSFVAVLFYYLPGQNKELHFLGSFWYFIDLHKK